MGHEQPKIDHPLDHHFVLPPLESYQSPYHPQQRRVPLQPGCSPEKQPPRRIRQLFSCLPQESCEGQSIAWRRKGQQSQKRPRRKEKQQQQRTSSWYIAKIGTLARMRRPEEGGSGRLEEILCARYSTVKLPVSQLSVFARERSRSRRHQHLPTMPSHARVVTPCVSPLDIERAFSWCLSTQTDFSSLIVFLELSFRFPKSQRKARIQPHTTHARTHRQSRGGGVVRSVRNYYS